MVIENFAENVQREMKDRLSDDERWGIFLQGVDGFSEDFFAEGRLSVSHCDFMEIYPQNLQKYPQLWKIYRELPRLGIFYV